jgi:hypothetical protein
MIALIGSSPFASFKGSVIRPKAVIQVGDRKDNELQQPESA